MCSNIKIFPKLVRLMAKIGRILGGGVGGVFGGEKYLRGAFEGVKNAANDQQSPSASQLNFLYCQ